MMLELFLTPASVSFLTQFILTLAISVYLLIRLRSYHTPQLATLAVFFIFLAAFFGAMFLDVSLSPTSRLLYAVYAENTILALAMLFLIQFAYSFPRRHSQHKWESTAALVISLAYVLWETGFMIYRYVSLLGQGTVHYRPYFAAYWMAFVLVLPSFAFLRQCIAADARPVGWLKKLWRPEGKGARGARAFVGVFGMVFLIGLTNVLLIVGLSHTVYYAVTSIGSLVAVWLFASVYINHFPGGVSVQVKLSVLALTIFLAILGSAGWFIAPSYIETFQPALMDGQTLRFIPNSAGGYDVDEVAFAFESELGDRLTVQHEYGFNSYPVDFDFTFYGQAYDQVFVSSYGVIVMGEAFWEPNMQANAAGAPAIYPLLIDLDADPAAGEGGLYTRLDGEGERLIVTWDHLPSFYDPKAVFTFQAVLYSDGVFEFNYNGLPKPFEYNPDASPRDNPWMRGVVSGQGEPLHTNTTSLLETAEMGGSPLLENFHQAFRGYLHAFILPLAAIVIGGSLLLMTGLPLLLRFSIILPLDSLMDGVRQMEAGDLTVELPVQHEDEVGYLTGAFNAMAARLGEFVMGLERLVEERTSELAIANENLQAQLSKTEALQTELREQAIRDPLTNAFNRRYLLETLGREISRAERGGYPLSLIMLDIDHFKQVNDDHGHQAGDLVLQRVVELLMETTRKGDVVCRYGGEEFVVLMPGISQEAAYQRAEGWRTVCEGEKFDCGEFSADITLSLGVATYLNSEVDGEKLLNMADQAMYRAKAAGRNCTVGFE